MLLEHLIFILIVLDLVISSKIDSKIYLNIYKYQPCVQLANATHQIGCTSDRNGNRGTIHLITSDQDVDWLIQHGPYPPYVPLIDTPMFKVSTMQRLIESKKISGALVTLNQLSPSLSSLSSILPENGFSPDPVCPLDNFGLYAGDNEYGDCKKVKWNPHGNGMSMAYYGVPIFSLSDGNEIKKIIECSRKYNYENGKVKDYPLCSVEMKDFMYAAKDTPTCKRKSEMSNPIRSTYCDPLGDENVVGTLYPMVEELKERSVIMVSTKLDSTGFFHDLAPGADNGVTGIVTLLAAAYALGEYKRKMKEKNVTDNLRPIMFTFFNGEVWDYIGSSRMVWDMEKGTFPYQGKPKRPFNGSIDDDSSVSKMDLSNIGYFLEISQVGLGTDGKIYAHSDPISQRDRSVQDEVDKIKKALESGTNTSGTPFQFIDRESKHPLPPASLQRFLRSDKRIPGIVIADHEKEFDNKFYNSRFDNDKNLGVGLKKPQNNTYEEMHGKLPANLKRLSEAVATSLLILATEGKLPREKLVVPSNLTANLLHCFLYSANCSVFKEVNDGKLYPLTKQPYLRYVSIADQGNAITDIVYRLFAYYTGERLPNCTDKSETDLPKALTYLEVPGSGSSPICVKAATYKTPALSPAFEKEDFTSTEYSTWTESMWHGDMGIQMFLVADPKIEGLILFIGLLMFAVSFALVYFFKRKATVLFTPRIIPMSR